MLDRFYYSLKTRLNFLFDRVIETSNDILMDTHRFSSPLIENAAKRIAPYAGEIAWRMRDYPRLSVYRLTGDKWTVIYVGRERGLSRIGDVFFGDTVSVKEIGRVALWELNAQSQAWLGSGVDLVVCELGRFSSRKPTGVFTFTLPTRVHQGISISDSMDAILRQINNRGLQNKLRKTRQNGFAYRFSRDEDDFRDFHHRLYLPYIKDRHGKLAITEPYEVQRRCLQYAGVGLVMMEGEVVAGQICYVADGICHAVVGGYLHKDERLKSYGVNAIMDFLTIEWAKEQGASYYNIGISDPWSSDGVFTYKRRWGAKPRFTKEITGQWTFVMNDPSPAFREEINRLSFVSEVDGRYYRVVLLNCPNALDEDALREEVCRAQHECLDGIIIIAPNEAPIIRT